MENKPYTDKDLEQFVRQELLKNQDTPDDLVWGNIAAKQGGLNRWLRLRHYALRVLPIVAVLALAGFGWWHYTSGNQVEDVNHDSQNLPQQVASQQLGQPQADVEQIPKGVFSENPQHTEQPIKPAHSGGGAYSQRLKNIPATTVRFAAEDGFRYENPATGTEVHIPANALARADGSPVSGEVEFELREYRNLAEFVASGIPMHYADERGSFFFNSGGMFDVRVNQRGESLQLVPGQACDVRFRSTHALTQPSLFYFDENANAWGYQPDPAFLPAVATGVGGSTQQPNNPTIQLPPIVSEAIAVRDNLGLTSSGGCLPPVANTLPAKGKEAAWVKDAVQLGHNLAFGKTTVPPWFRKNPNFSTQQFFNGMERSLVRLVRHRDSRDNFFPEDINGVFTELQAFKDCYFICSDSLNRKSFTEADIQAYWERVSVTQQQGSMCYVSFFGKQGLLQFYATLVGSTGNDDFDADQVMAEYRRLQEIRRNGFEDQINTWRRFLAVSPAFQTAPEWCMEPTEWFDYFDNNLPLMRKRYTALLGMGLSTSDPLALKTWKDWRNRLLDLKFAAFDDRAAQGKLRTGLEYTLRVSNFGLHNCDQIFQISNSPQYMLAAYQTPDGQRVVPASVSVMDRQTKLFFTLPRQTHLLYVPGRQLDIVLTDARGRFYHLQGDDYARLDLTGKNSHTFWVNDVTERTQTPREWARLLEI